MWYTLELVLVPASFSKDSSRTTIWNTFTKIWSSVYVGFPDLMLTDQRPIFIWREWKYNCESSKIDLFNTGAESHNSLGIGKKYHWTLRTIYRKVLCDHRTFSEDVALAKSVQAMNETAEAHRLVPTLLVLGVIPKLPDRSERAFPAQRRG